MKKYLFVIAAILLSYSTVLAIPPGQKNPKFKSVQTESVTIGTTNHSITRSGDSMVFTDPNNPGGLTLSQLLAGALGLVEGDIDTLAKLNAIIGDATLLDDGAISDSAAIGLTAGDSYSNFGSAGDDSLNEMFAAIDTALGLLGGGGISDIVEDTTPQLGGNLDLNGNEVSGISAAEFTVLNVYGGINPSANVQSLLGAADYPAFKALIDTDDMQTALGISAGATHLGTFTGSTIDDSQTVKAALQALETAVEGVGGGHDPVTIGTANGLSLSTQELSLAAATSSNAGAMTAAQVQALEAIDTEGELEALCEVADFQGNLAWSRISSTPTTLSGYGITDGASTSGITRGSIGTGIPDILGSYNIYWEGTLTANRSFTVPDRAFTLDNITTSTTSDITGLLKADGSNVAQAVAGTDYYAPGGTDVADADIVAAIARDSEVPGISSWMPVPVFTLNIKDAADDVDDVKKKFPRGITLTAVYGICIGGTNVIGTLSEVDSDGDDSDAVVIDSAWTITTSQFSDTSFTNAAIDANDWLQWDTTSVSGSVTNFTLVAWGYEN